MANDADLIADTVLAKFRSLSKRFKPRSDGTQEWVPVAGMVLRNDEPNSSTKTGNFQPKCTCVALATGMKCHPHNKLPYLQGCGLHDWHAETLAIRAFNRFLVDECADLAAGALGDGSAWLKWRSNYNGLSDAHDVAKQPFELRDDVSIHMYISEAPCGDASMELTMAKQEDATPWSSSEPSKPDVNGHMSMSGRLQDTGANVMNGRGHFDQLGKVRRKPSRPDAPATLSKSCSDKLALKQCTGLLSALSEQLVWPGNVYLQSLIIPESEYVAEACERSFGATGRMASLNASNVQENWKRHGFSFIPFAVQTTRREFEYSKRYLKSQTQAAALEPVASNRSCVLTPRSSEVLINGVLEGRKWHDPHGASMVSRRRMWKSTLGIAATLGLPVLSVLSAKCSYGELKATLGRTGRGEVKDDVRRLALREWEPNSGDDAWSLSNEERSEAAAIAGSNSESKRG